MAYDGVKECEGCISRTSWIDWFQSWIKEEYSKSW